LAERLAQCGASDVAERLLGHQLIRTEDKSVVREVLGRWRRSARTSFPPELDALQEQLAQEHRRSWPTHAGKRRSRLF
jgi:hypothetical protein